MTDFTNRDAEKRVALLGVPIEVGASQRGALMGPAALRTAGLGALLESLGFTVEDRDRSISRPRPVPKSGMKHLL